MASVPVPFPLFTTKKQRELWGQIAERRIADGSVAREDLLVWSEGGRKGTYGLLVSYRFKTGGSPLRWVRPTAAVSVFDA